MINIGIIGCGRWGNNHIRVLSHSAKTKVALICDKDRRRLAVLCKRYPGVSAASDYTAVIKDRRIDAVVVATPTVTHYQIVKTALNNDKHVLCEKPLTIKASQSKELIELARKKQKILMVGYVFLFNRGISILRDYLRKRKSGKIMYLNFSRTNLGPIREDVDVIDDLASHDISIAAFLLNAWPKAVSASAAFFLGRKKADVAFVTMYYPNNILAHIHLSWLDPKKLRMITCVTDKKMVIWDDLDPAGPIKVLKKGNLIEPFYLDFGEFQQLPRKEAAFIPSIKLTEPLRDQDNYFLHCISQRRRPLTDAVFGHKVARVLEAIHLSLKNKGRQERIRWA